MFIVFLVLAVIFLAYYVGIVSYIGFHASFSFIWLVLAFLMIGGAVCSRIMRAKGISMKLPLKISLISIVCVIIIFFGVVEGFIISAMNAKPDKNLDYIIVLGAQVDGNVPSLPLQYRIDEAEKYLKENPKTIAVLSGGQGKLENISEALCMKKSLNARGIGDERLILEDKSTDTRENIENSLEILSNMGVDTQNAKMGIVTNNFHVFRAQCVAKKVGKEMQGLAAYNNKFTLVHYMVREFIGLCKYKLCGEI